MNIEEVRRQFNVAHKTKQECDQLIQSTSNEHDAIAKAYNVAGKMISTKFIPNPFISVKIFNEGKRELEGIITVNPNETEIIYLRYTIQRNIPKLLGYYKNLPSDKLLLAKYINENKESALSKHMMVFIDDTKDQILGLLK